MFDLTNEIRGFKNEGWEAYRQKLISTYSNKDAETNFEHISKQTYMPMEGFDADALDKILKLREKGLRSTLLLPLGYRDADRDWMVNLKKVRKPMGKMVRFVK